MIKEPILRSRLIYEFVLLAIAVVAFSGLFSGCTRNQRGYGSAARSFNKGSEHFAAGEYGLAAECFDEALSLRPGWDTARENRDIALKRSSPTDWLEAHPLDDNVRMKIWTDCLSAREFESALYHAEMMSNPTNRHECIRLTRLKQQAQDPRSITNLVAPRDQANELLSSNNELTILTSRFYQSKKQWPVSLHELQAFDMQAARKRGRIHWNLYTGIEFLVAADGNTVTLVCDLAARFQGEKQLRLVIRRTGGEGVRP